MRVFAWMTGFVFMLFTGYGVSGQNQLMQLSQLGLKAGDDVVVRGTTAYYATSSSLDVLDVADPASPVLIGRLPWEGVAKPRIAISGDYVYVCDRDSGSNHQYDLYIVRIVNPRRPVLFSHLKTSPCRDFGVSSDVVYVATSDGVNGEDGIECYDVSNKLDPQYIQTIPTEKGPFSLFLDGSTLYVSETEQMEIFDIADISNPVRLAKVDFEGYGESVCVHNGYAFVAGYWTGGIHIIDVSDPESPTLKQTVDAYGANLGFRLVAEGNFVYFTYSTDYSHETIGILDMRDPGSPQVLNINVGEFGILYGIFVASPYLYVTGWVDGLHIVNIANPETPFLVEGTSLFGLSGKLALSSHALYVLSSFKPEQMWILDTSQPYRLDYVGSMELSQELGDIDANGDLLAGSVQGEPNLLLYDVSDPAVPTLLSNSSVVGEQVERSEHFEILLDGDRAYLSNDNLHVLDVSDPRAPVHLGEADLIGMATADLTVEGDLVYVLAQFGGVSIIDVSTPQAPERIGEINLESMGMAMEKSGNYLFVTNWSFDNPGETGLRIIDVSDPSGPVLVSSLNTHGPASDLLVEGDTVYIADGASGILLVDVSNVSSPELKGSYVPMHASYDMLRLTDNGKLIASDVGWECVRLLDTRFRTNVPTAPFALGNADDSVTVAPWLINPDQFPVTVELSWRNESGDVIETTRDTVPPFGKLDVLSKTEKSKTLGADNVEIATDKQVLSYHEISGSACRMIASLKDSRGAGLILPHIAEATEYWNTLTLISDRTAESTEFRLGTGEDYQLNGAYSWTHDVEALLANPQEETAWGQYVSDPPSASTTEYTLSGYELFVKEGNDGAAVELPEEPSNTIYIPHIPTNTDLFWTGFTMVNPNDTTASVWVRFFTDDGVELDSQRIYIQPQSKMKGLMESLFPAVHGSASWGIIRSDVPIVALELYGTYNAGICGYGLPYELKTELVLPMVQVEGGDWTGIAMTNANNENVQVTIELRSAEGDTKASWTGEIAAYSRIKDVIQNYFTGASLDQSDYVHISSSKGILATEVAGSEDWSYLKAIAGMF